MRYIKKKDRIKKKCYLILSLISLILCFSVIKDTYAKYITSTEGDANIEIARWKILVNNQDVEENKELSNVITPVFEGNEHIAKNVIAPTAEGYFDILIDANNTDVSLKYQITTSDNETSAVQDLVISGFAIDDGEKQPLNTDEDQIKIENDILYNSPDKDFKLRVFLTWNDFEEQGAIMDNIADTIATKDENSLAKVNVQVKFIQIPQSQIIE